MLGAAQRHVQWLLAHQQDLQGRPHVECRTDQQPQVGQRLAVKEMSLIEDQQQRAFRPLGPFQDLLIEPLLATPPTMLRTVPARPVL